MYIQLLNLSHDVGNHRKRTIYIDSDLDKDFAKTAIDEEVTYSELATQAFKAYLLAMKKKGGKSGVK